jgi:cell wall-associated NlpC family hydrolase
MSLRTFATALALIVTGSAATGAVAAAGPVAQIALRAGTTTPTAQTVWVSAGVATVWVKPARTRRVDAPALKAHPDITRWINRQTLRQRSDLGPRVMTQALHGDKLVRLERRTDGWSKVELPAQTGNKFPDGIIGWIPTRQLSTTRVSHPVLRNGITPHGSGRTVLRTARTYLGVRYLWGGMSKAGLDCSGLTYRVFRSLGVVLPRDAADQSKVGVPVARRDLRKGDLVFFGTGGWAQIHHVGIYAGNGRVLHAPYTGTTVQLTRLHTWSDYWGARRIR